MHKLDFVRSRFSLILLTFLAMIAFQSIIHVVVREIPISTRQTSVGSSKSPTSYSASSYSAPHCYYLLLHLCLQFRCCIDSIAPRPRSSQSLPAPEESSDASFRGNK
ncbi:unnamed protein product [Linum trigynum]|uniref:Uncharacterized protein n=1 Tax=Linum trigynum TaxID=586398 RepID=A0AAV2CV39_9ROSI